MASKLEQEQLRETMSKENKNDAVRANSTVSLHLQFSHIPEVRGGGIGGMGGGGIIP